ncbi:MAG: AAA family ATPase [Pseudomonadota bacterium]|nr:AAA family ATPase [Pseudomonadota bacterium]
MKIRTLFLNAFGPFTQTTLDFSGPANLHVIYGPNEAGKSSALRAITDLRYGIPARSKDNFVHEFGAMQVAGCFEDVAGRAVGLFRRKGNHDTLSCADPATGAPLAGMSVSPEVLLALTGGVGREQFETMYGLNSAHLRQGGQLLIQGEGELGAALFEASTGSAGIKRMLDTLRTDAKKYFLPKGQLPLLNEAARQLDEAKHRYKLAIVKPEQWKTLKHAHEAAHSHLATVRTELAGRRGRLAELVELRAVEPLLQGLTLKENEWTQVQGCVALPEDARDNRLAALQQQAQAQGALLEAQGALAQCEADLQALRIEPQLLEHAGAIDRLAADLALVRRGQGERIRLQTAAESEAAQLLLQAAQIAGPGGSVPSLEEFFRRAPSVADQAELARLLDALKSLKQELAHAQEHLSACERKLALHQREAVETPALALQQALAVALAQAQPLGDAPQRLADLQATVSAGQRRLARDLSDLGLASLDALTASRWLAPAEMDACEHERRDLQQQAALSQNNFKNLQADLAEQQRRHKSLSATGEVVTAATLRHARTVRDASWKAIRGALMDQPPGDEPAKAVASEAPHAFERLQEEADRQADLLREGAARAAEVAECEQRIADMTQALAELQRLQVRQANALAALDAAWQGTLARLGIPAGTAAVVREWQALRQSALERHERLTESAHQHAALAGQISAASASLLAALQALGLAPPDGAAALPALTALGAEAERRLLAQQAAIAQRASDMAALAQDMAEGHASVARLAQLFDGCQRALDDKSRPLYLAQGAAAETLKARLDELARWVQAYQRHVERLQQVRAMKDSEEAAISAAGALGQLVQEPVWDHLEAWLDALVLRLARTREAVQLKTAGERTEAEELKRQQRAQADLESAAQMLARLVAQAGVSNADELAQAETRSERRREVAARLQELKDQLAKTSRKEAAALRAELAGLDSAAIDAEKEACESSCQQLETDEKIAIDAEQACRAALAQVDTSDQAAQAREAMEDAIARYRAGVRPWAQLKLAEALLAEALRRHRDKAQGPVVALASEYFRLMTGGRFTRLLVDADSAAPLLLAQPAKGNPMGIAALSEGTADQLYLALRLAALQVQRQPERMMPLVLDDVFMTADDERAANMFRALEQFAAQAQVMVFTHHHHLLGVASGAVAAPALRLHQLAGALERSA